MGQYYKVCNKTKKEYLNPHTFGNGLKLMEFTSDGSGVLQGLSLLLANGNGRGGGDFRHEDEDNLIGSWSGDSITIEGDYADNTLWDVMSPTRYGENGDEPNPDYVEGWTDISEKVFLLLMKDEYVRQREEENIKEWGMPTYSETRMKVLTKVFGDGK